MNGGELLSLFRQQADDAAAPYLWSDTEIYAWLTDAEREAARRARLIVDSATAAVCTIAVVANTAQYALDARIIYIRRVKLASRTLPLEPLDYRDLDACTPGWESHTGTVSAYVRGMDSNKLRIYRKPTAVDSINLLVVREPLLALSAAQTTLEIAARYHVALLDWVCFRAYSKKDSQAYDPDLAGKHATMFEAEFGTREKSAAFEEEWQRNHQPFSDHDGTY